jgi:hypothetical protein
LIPNEQKEFTAHPDLQVSLTVCIRRLILWQNNQKQDTLV